MVRCVRSLLYLVVLFDYEWYSWYVAVRSNIDQYCVVLSDTLWYFWYFVVHTASNGKSYQESIRVVFNGISWAKWCTAALKEISL